MKLKGIIFIIVLFFAVLGVKYLFPEFFDHQVNKVRGMYLMHKGDKALELRKWQKAIDYYKQGLSLYPEHYSAWHNLGSIYVLYEDYGAALDAYSEAIKYNPKFIVARMNYGIVSAEKLGDFDAAINQYDEIIKTKRKLLNIPWVFDNKKSTKVNKGYAFYNKGVAYKQKSLFTDKDDYILRKRYLMDALEAYKSAVKILKKNYEAQYNLALTNHLLGNTREAGFGYCKAIALSPMSYEAHYNLAILLKNLNHYQEAREELQKAAELIMYSDGFSNRQSYIFDILAEVSRTVYEYDKENPLVEHLSDSKPDPETLKITYVNGKMVYSEELDKAILKNFSTCKAFKIFKTELEDDEDDLVFRKKVSLPR